MARVGMIRVHMKPGQPTLRLGYPATLEIRLPNGCVVVCDAEAITRTTKPGSNPGEESTSITFRYLPHGRRIRFSTDRTI